MRMQDVEFDAIAAIYEAPYRNIYKDPTNRNIYEDPYRNIACE